MAAGSQAENGTCALLVEMERNRRIRNKRENFLWEIADRMKFHEP
jgi:hypothetical protein